MAVTEIPSPDLLEGYTAYIKPNQIFLKPEVIKSTERKSAGSQIGHLNLTNRKRRNELSNNAAKRLHNALNWLIAGADSKRVYDKKTGKTWTFKITFLTLTIPPQENRVISAKEFRSCLNTFLTYSRRFQGLKNYVWKLEGHKDGRIHCHLTTDIFFHHRKLREVWNRILKERGLLEFHHEKFNNYDPNSTDVHSVKKIQNLPSYLTAYYLKPSNLPTDFTGYIWRASQSLSSKITCKTFLNIEKIGAEIEHITENCEYFQLIIEPATCTHPERILGYLYGVTVFVISANSGGKIYQAYRERLIKLKEKYRQESFTFYD